MPAATEVGAAPTTLRRDPVAWAILVLVWFSCAWFGSWEFNPNNAVRMFATLSLVEDRDATIDEFAHLTIDKAHFGEHYYSDKAPGMTVLGIPAVALADAVSGQSAHDFVPGFENRAFNRFLKIRIRLVAVTVCALLTALAAMLLYDLVRGVTGDGAAGAVAALSFALGTTMWGWSTTIFGHAPVAALMMIATWAVWRGTGPARSRGHAVAAGLALGWAVLIEHSALVAGLPVAGFALWRLRDLPRDHAVRTVAIALAAGATALVVLVGYNLLAFGTVFRLGYSGVTDFAGMQEGLFGLTYPKLRVLFELIFGERRGMLWVAPILIVAPFGLAMLVREPATRAIGWLAVAGAVVPFLINASYYYWDGGNATGPRHALPAVGFLGIGIGMFWARAGRWSRIAVAALLAGSIVLNMAIASAEITAPQDEPHALAVAVFAARFDPGYLRTVADEWLGFTPWQGLAIWAVVAAVLTIGLAALVHRARRQA
ncbi:phospholipid carrier-dependent glycosyltransferase [Sphingomonas hankookensis]|uniref:phospholipid carrier-dependent glycosyltransferase n=1 Tax=Sphingomonas hankookensis TaxID=563996 RepID=UPI0026D9E517